MYMEQDLKQNILDGAESQEGLIQDPINQVPVLEPKIDELGNRLYNLPKDNLCPKELQGDKKIVVITDKVAFFTCRYGEWRAFPPNYIKYIEQNQRFITTTTKGITTKNMLSGIIQSIVEDIGDPYSNYMSIPYSKFEGIQFENSEDLNRVICQIVDKYLPDIMEVKVKEQLRNCPKTCRILYYISDNKNHLPVFIKMGYADASVGGYDDNFITEVMAKKNEKKIRKRAHSAITKSRRNYDKMNKTTLKLNPDLDELIKKTED